VYSWFDVYQMLRHKAEASRGTITLTSDGVPTVSFPRTTVRDAFAIALVFDSAVHDRASRATAMRWLREADLLTGEAEDSTHTYVGNRSLWETLAAVALELDHAHASLPPRSVLDDVLRTLEVSASASAPRNATAPMFVTLLTEPSWKAMALRQFEFFCSLRGEMAGGNPLAPTIPATRNADVLALADYWTEQLTRVGDNASDTYHRMVYSCWREVLHRVRQHAEHAPAHDIYIHNNDFWTALLLLATQSDASDAPPAAWAFRVPASGFDDDPHHGHQDPHAQPRNAAAIDTGSTLEFPAAKTWDEAAQIQRDAFSKLRGEDAITGRLIGRVPRTTVADVRQLAAYWSAGLAKLGEHSFADVSYHHVLDRWKTAVAAVAQIPAAADPASVYPHNTDFWEALITIAIQVAVTADAPTRWQLLKEATKQAMADLPQTLSDLPQTLKTAAQDLAAQVLARPLLYAGIGLGGIALAVLVLRRSGHRESRS
jgi:hypothetical protein